MSNRRLALVFIAAAVLATAAGTAMALPTRDPEVLQVALLPDENASKVIQDNNGLKQYLEHKLSKKIELHVLTSYAAMVEATRNTRIDLAFFGPLSYCMAKDKAAIEPFAAKVKNGSTTYRAVIIAAAGSGIARLEDVRGKRMAYGDTASTSSHLIPKGMLARAGLKPGDYAESFLGKHDAVALNVMRGNVDAGGLSQVIFKSLVEKGTIDAAKVRVIAESDPIPEYPWVMQADLAPSLKEQIRKAFMELRDPAILKPLKADSFASIQDADYDVIRNAATILGLDLGSLEK
ncbi:MAG: phosphate/phosphite/phosphonate ABC transporter substrate-binding protein [Candidatus Methylomirabilia bacterium]